jgi:hypothetical protein
LSRAAQRVDCGGDGWLLFGALLKRRAVFPLDDVPIKRKIDVETCCKKLATRRRLPKELRPRSVIGSDRRDVVDDHATCCDGNRGMWQVVDTTDQRQGIPDAVLSADLF